MACVIGPDFTRAPVAVDWNHVHARLEQLGVVKLQRDRLPQGGFQVILVLPGHRDSGDTARLAHEPRTKNQLSGIFDMQLGSEALGRETAARK